MDRPYAPNSRAWCAQRAGTITSGEQFARNLPDRFPFPYTTEIEIFERR
jgi:hypothetical protein